VFGVVVSVASIRERLESGGEGRPEETRAIGVIGSGLLRFFATGNDEIGRDEDIGGVL
jgi:hypothetical protein